jgi:hypothetical protein
MKHKILRESFSTRGGGVEISLSKLGKKYADERMTAYQNYLGGGMLGSIQNDCTIDGWSLDEKLVKTARQLRLYMYEAIHGESDGFEVNEMMPASAY